MHAVTTCTVGHFHRSGLLGEAVIAILKTPEPVTGETELLGELDRGVAGGTDLRRHIARSYRRASVFGRKDVVFSMAVGTGRRRDNPASECGAMDAIVVLLADGRMALGAGVLYWPLQRLRSDSIPSSCRDCRGQSVHVAARLFPAFTACP
jgi:hypothetical protein